MRTFELREVSKAVGAPISTVHRWLEQELVSDIPDASKPGVSRALTRHQGLQLALFSQLVKLGISPRHASLFIDPVENGYWPRWIACGFDRESFEYTVSEATNLTEAMEDVKFYKNPKVTLFIDCGAIADSFDEKVKELQDA